MKTSKPTAAPKTTLPKSIVSARVQLQDKKQIEELAETMEVDISIITSIAVLAGDNLIRNQETAVALRSQCDRYLWMCINRDPRDYTETVPVDINEGDLFENRTDAKNLKRDLGDWLGTLIHIGLQALNSPAATETLLDSHTSKLKALFQAEAFRALNEGGAK